VTTHGVCQPARGTTRKLVRLCDLKVAFCKCNEAHRIAANIAKLPEQLGGGAIK
jgi:hypothetical protein